MTRKSLVIIAIGMMAIAQGTFLPDDLQVYGSRVVQSPDVKVVGLQTVNMSFNGTLTAFETEARAIYTKSLTTLAIKSPFTVINRQIINPVQAKGRVSLLPSPKVVEDYDNVEKGTHDVYHIPEVDLFLEFTNISTIEKEIRIPVNSSGNYFIKGRLEFYNDIPGLSYVKINDQYAWIVPLQTTGNLCSISSNSGFNVTSLVAKTNDVFRSRVILNDSKSEVVLKFGVNFSSKCETLLYNIQENLDVAAFEFKDVLLVKSK